MNDVRVGGPPPSLELGILGSFLTRLNFRFYPSPGEIMLTTTPPPSFLLLSSPSLTHLSTSIFFFFWRSANSFFLLNEYLYCRGWGVVAKRYDGFCGVILMAYLVANVHGCKKHYKQFTNRIIILLKNKQKARNKRNVNKTKHYI